MEFSCTVPIRVLKGRFPTLEFFVELLIDEISVIITKKGLNQPLFLRVIQHSTEEVGCYFLHSQTAFEWIKRFDVGFPFICSIRNT